MPQADFYSQIASGYNKLHSQEQLKKAMLIKSKIELSGLLLDIGAGTGIATLAFAEKAKCIALDPCLEMLQQCNCLKVVAKAEKLPFKENCFDSITAITALHHCNLPLALGEINRVGKKHCKIAISFFKRAKSIEKAKKLFQEFEQIEEERDLVFLKEP